MDKNRIKLKGHVGSWYVIDEIDDPEFGHLYLLEHCTWGDMTSGVIVNEKLEIVLDDVYGGFEDLEYLRIRGKL